MPNLDKPFDDQMIISFDANVPAEALQKKYKRQYQEKKCPLLHGFTLLQRLNAGENFCWDQYFTAQDHIKISVVAHGNVAVNALTGDGNDVITLNEMASLLYCVASTHSVEINLIACCAGRGENDDPKSNFEKSFASKLQTVLYQKYHLYHPIVARTQLVCVCKNEKHPDRFGRKTTCDIHINSNTLVHEILDKSESFYKQPGSKILFFANNDEQVVVDANIVCWRRKVINTLNHWIQDTTQAERKLLLQAWIADFGAMETSDMCEALKKGLKLPLINPRRFFFFTNKAIDSALKKLIAEGEKLLKSPDSILKPIHVRDYY